MTEVIEGMYTDDHDQTNYKLLVNNEIVSLGDIVIDVGACNGTYVHMFHQLLGATGEIHAIEIMPQNFEFLELMFGHLKNVFFYNVAASDKEGTEPVYIQGDFGEGNPETCGIVNTGGTHVGDVSSARLDTMFANKSEISLIKIDVEGAELKVLRGMTELLKRTKTVLIECHFDEDWDEIKKILIEENGFKCYNIAKREQIINSSPRAYQCLCVRDKE